MAQTANGQGLSSVLPPAPFAPSVPLSAQSHNRTGCVEVACHAGLTDLAGIRPGIHDLDLHGGCKAAIPRAAQPTAARGIHAQHSVGEGRTGDRIAAGLDHMERSAGTRDEGLFNARQVPSAIELRTPGARIRPSGVRNERNRQGQFAGAASASYRCRESCRAGDDGSIDRRARTGRLGYASRGRCGCRTRRCRGSRIPASAVLSGTNGARAQRTSARGASRGSTPNGTASNSTASE